jgi:Flp pilus assembly protein CpaB
MVGRIPLGFRAVSVKIDEVTAAGYQIQPGDWVDVIVVMDIDTGNNRKKETIAEVILQHVQVAAVGQGTNPSEQEGASTKVKPAKSATLLVPEAEVPKLHLAGTRGKLTLAMRGEDDVVSEMPAKALGSEVLKFFGEPAPTPAPAPAPPVLATRLPTVNEPEPHSVLVFHHSTIANQATAVDQFTFESPHSAKLVAVGKGAPTRASATMSGAKQGGVRPQPAGSAATGAKPAEPETDPGDDEPSDDKE